MSHQLFADDIQFYQRILRISGFYTGPIDGQWTAAIDAADQQFDAAYQTLKAAAGSFDARSETNIHTLIPQAQRAAREFLARAATGFSAFTVRIISGTRTYAEQNQLFAKGRFGNPPPIVTHAKGGESNHNFGIAWDVGIFDGGRYLTGDSPGETKTYRDLAPVVMTATLEWGGSWTSFPDLPHYQMHTGLTLAEIQQRFEAGAPLIA